MLCQFTFKNFRSFRDEMTLDLTAASISEHEDQIIKAGDDDYFLPVAALYGPNAGGKSNVLIALNALVTSVLKPVLTARNLNDFIGLGSNIRPFCFSEKSMKEPVEFELIFQTGKAEYLYQLSVKDNLIVYEKLDRFKLETRKRSGLFERDGDRTETKGDLAKIKINSDISETLPLLSYLAITYGNNEIIKDVTDWFLNRIRFLNYGNPVQEENLTIIESGEYKNLILKMFEEMDLDIKDYRLQQIDDKRYEIYTKHVVDHYEAELNLMEESRGTYKIFHILPYIAESLLNGSVLVVDELDAKLHPALLEHIIKMFTDQKINRHGSQLIFTSQDISTMNGDVFRRDEIWFVAKGNQENSKLYSLVEFKTKSGDSVRKDAKYSKQYLEGKYGADPYLTRIINWGNPNGKKEQRS